MAAGIVRSVSKIFPELVVLLGTGVGSRWSWQVRVETLGPTEQFAFGPCWSRHWRLGSISSTIIGRAGCSWWSQDQWFKLVPLLQDFASLEHAMQGFLILSSLGQLLRTPVNHLLSALKGNHLAQDLGMADLFAEVLQLGLGTLLPTACQWLRLWMLFVLWLLLVLFQEFLFEVLNIPHFLGFDDNLGQIG